jgi:glucan biosynthesis protein C
MTIRRADLDWLRVLAFSLLILYHAGMAWSGWSWHVTSPDSMEWLREAMRFLNRWRMPLLFLVSGAAIMLALGDRTSGAFVVA